MKKINGIFSLLMALSTGASLISCAVVSDRESLGEYVDDSSITTKVKTAILKDKLLAPFQIHVETMQNVVQLSGFVDSKKSAAKAEQLVREIEGVQRVENNLLVR